MKQKILYFSAIFTVLGAFSLVFGQSAYATSTETNTGGGAGLFLGLPAWHRGLTDGNGSIKQIGEGGIAIETFIWTIVGNLVDIALHIIGYAAVLFIIWAGIQYMTSTGDPSKAASAKNTLTNAVIGLLLAIFASAIIQLIIGVF